MNGTAHRTGFALRDLLGVPELGLDLRAGPDAALDAPLRGAHSIEIANPSRWLERDWVMLTTGVRLSGEDAEQRALIGELAEAGTAGLGFAVGLVFDEVPGALLEEAEQRAFPVFAVPIGTAFREVIGTVNRSVLEAEQRSFQRLTTLQRHLLDAFEDAEPRTAILERLARVLDVSVSLIPPSGGTEQAAAAPPGELLETALAGRPASSVELELDGWRLYATPVPGGGWLVAAGRRRFVNDLTKPVIQAAVPLLVASRRLEDALERQRRAAEAALLDDLLDAGAGAELATLRRRAELTALDPGHPSRVVVVARADGTAADGDPLVAALETEGVRAPLVSSLPGGETVVLTQGPGAELLAALRELTAGEPLLQAGVGRECEELTELRQSFRDGWQALELIRRGESEDRLLDFDRLDLEAVVLANVPAERIGAKLEETLAAVRQQPHLYAALVAYFEFEMDAALAAESLCLHTNSLRYRLGRIESLLGRSLKSPATIANLHLALTAERGKKVA